MLCPNTNSETTVESGSRFDFDSIADKYDRWYESPKGAMYDRLEKRAIARHLNDSFNGRTLLEVGCGTGHWSQFFSDHGFEVTGVDVCERMIDVAKNKNIPRASFQLADGHCLPFPDESFDVVAAITALEFVSDARRVIGEMVRCTRTNGGKLLIGALNALARINRKRQKDSASPYARATMFSPSQLKTLLEPYGRVHMLTVGFVPDHTSLILSAPLLDAIGRLLHMPYGGLIAAEVDL